VATHRDATRDPVAVAATLAAFGHQARAAVVLPVRRHGRFAATALASALAPHITVEPADAPASDDSLRLFVLCGDDAVYAGMGHASACGSAYAGGMPRWCHAAADADAASRAGDKLREAHAWLVATGGIVGWPRRCLELGAFPGGMTEILAQQGTHVEAVDKASASAALTTLMRTGAITYATADALTHVPTAPFDMLVCDINGPPRPALDNLARLAHWHRAGGALVHTVKLPSWDAWPALWDHATTCLTNAGYAQIEARHLAANRQELALFARRLA
jgi:23S rRNA C2498 (ribose-2'-O)-methylase RlmM